MEIRCIYTFPWFIQFLLALLLHDGPSVAQTKRSLRELETSTSLQLFQLESRSSFALLTMLFLPQTLFHKSSPCLPVVCPELNLWYFKGYSYGLRLQGKVRRKGRYLILQSVGKSFHAVGCLAVCFSVGIAQVFPN